MNDSTRRMRPMGIADILDETVELYKSSFVLLVGIAAVMNVPYAIFDRYFGSARFAHFIARPDARIPSHDVTTFVGATAIGLLYLLITAPIVTGALTYAISERYLGRKITILDSFRRVFSASVFWQMLGAIAIKVAAIVVPILLIWLAIMIAAVSMLTTRVLAAPVAIVLLALGLAAGIAAIYVLLRLAVLEPTIIVEPKGIRHALSRTWKFMPGSMVKCFVLLLLAWLVTTVVELIVSGPTQTLVITKGVNVSPAILVIHTIVGAISSTVLAPVLSMVTILLYYDLRVRNEGFDLELLANDLDAKSRELGRCGSASLPHERTEQIHPESESSPQ